MPFALSDRITLVNPVHNAKTPPSAIPRHISKSSTPTSDLSASTAHPSTNFTPGTLTTSNNSGAHPLNAITPIPLTLSGIDTLLRFRQSLKAQSPMYLTPSPISMDSIHSSPRNAPFATPRQFVKTMLLGYESSAMRQAHPSTERISSETVESYSPSPQPRKASDSMLVTLSGIETLVNPTQPQNARDPIREIPSGNEIFVRL